MKQVDQLLTESAARLLASHTGPEALEAADQAGWHVGLWRELERADMNRVGLPEESGGSGGGLAEAAQLVRLAARRAAPVPLAETCLLAGWCLVEAGLPLPAGPLTVGVLVGDRALAVPYGRFAEAIVLVSEEGVGRVDRGEVEISEGSNLAGEPRDEVRLRGVLELRPGPDPDRLTRRAALARSVQMVGALETVLDLTVEHVRQREQFGQALARFQAVQQSIALLAGEVAAARVAAEAAVAAPGETLVAAAKIRCGQAASTGAALAHQLHGAIGFTYEHQLHRLTRRLWAWRDEYGAEAEWAARLGRLTAAAGADGLWPALTT